MEEGLWLMERADPSVDYAIRTRLNIAGVLDVERLRAALVAVVSRHAALRSTFVESAGSVACRILAAVPSPLCLVDLSGIDPARRDAALHAILDEVARSRIDLAQGPVFQATLVKRDASDWILWMVVHHMVFDEASNAVLVEEMVAGYLGHWPSGRPGSYGDYVRWLADEATDERRAFWRTQLTDLDMAQLAPVSEHRPDAMAQEPAPVSLAWNGEASRELIRACAALRCTPFVFLLGVMQIWLARYTGASGGVVGVPVSLRPEDDQPLIGLCLNTIPVRFRIDESLTLERFFDDLRRHVSDVLEHRALPFQQAVADIGMNRDGGAHAMLRHVFSYRTDMTDGQLALDGLRLTPVPVRFPEHGIALSLIATRGEDGFFFTLGGSSSVLAASGVEVVLRQYVDLLAQAVRPGNRVLGDLRLAAPPRRPRSEPAERAGSTVSARFVAQAAIASERIAVYDDDQFVSYSELAGRASVLSGALASRGVVGGDLVAIDVPAGAWRVACQLAVLRLGAGFVPMRDDWPTSMRQRIVASSRLLIIADSRDGVGSAMVTVADLTRDASTDGSRVVVAHPEATAFVIHTSGSTGESKPVLLTHRALDLIVEWACEWFSPSPEEVIAGGTSPAFDMSIFETVLPFAAGFACVTLPHPVALLESPHRDRVTWLNGVPTVLREIVAAAQRPTRLTRVTVGGEMVPPEWIRQLETNYAGIRVDNLYGPSEVTICALAQRLDTPQRHAVPPVGTELPTHRVRIVDANLNKLPPYAVGEFVFSGPCIGTGYQDAVSATAATFVPDPFSTRPGARMQLSGDLGYMSGDEVFHILGRRDAQTKLRGMRLDVGGVEAVLRECPGVVDAACVIVEPGTPGAWLGALLAAQGPVMLADVRTHLAKALPAWQLPTRLRVAGALPRTSSGKIDRIAVADSLAAPDSTSEVAPVSAQNAPILAIWREVLGHDVDDVDANFFDVGGTSLLVPRLHTRLLGLRDDLRLGDLFTHGTVRQQALLVAAGTSAHTTARDVSGQRPASSDREWRSAR